MRERTVDALVSRYHVDTGHARRIENTTMSLYGQVVRPWALDNPQYPLMLSWAARLHEIGLNVSHSQYQKHGAYLICNSDLSGFSLREQAVLAALVRGHRRKFSNEVFDALPVEVRQCTRRLCVLLRLAVLVHRGRSASGKPMLLLEVDNDDIRVSLPTDWLENHPLTRVALEEEAQRLQADGYRMRLG